MTRTITSAAETASGDEIVRPVMLVRLDFSSGVLVLNTADKTISYAGDDYLGVGDLGAIDAIEETGSVAPTGIKLSLTGIKPSFISIALGEDYQGRDCKIYTAFLDAQHALIDDPVLSFQGRMDFMSISMGETASISMTAENHLADWNRPRERRYNDKDQQDEFPGDLGLEFVEQMVEKEIVWGRS